MFAYAITSLEAPGFAVVTDQFVVLMSADVTPETVRAVHRLVDSPAVTTRAAIELLSGDDGADRFAVVEIVDPWSQEFHVTVRGDIMVDLGGASTTRFTWPHGDQLLTGEATGVESLHLALTESPADAPRLPLRHGAVAASAVFLDETRTETGRDEADHSDTIVRRRPVAALEAPPSSNRSVEPAAPTSKPKGKSKAKAKPATEPEVIPKPKRTPEPDRKPATASAVEPVQAVEPAQAVEAAPAVAPVTTVAPASAFESASAVDLEAPPQQAPERVDPRPQPIDLESLMSSHPTPVWTLTLPDGNELFAAPLIVVGRRPWHSDPEATQTYYIKAPSPHREISGKHVEFTVSGGRLRARDLDSTNGTLVESADRAPRLLRDGQDTTLDIGDVLDLGEGFRIVVGVRAEA